MSLGDLVAEALTTLAALVRAALGWVILTTAATTAAVLASIAGLGRLCQLIRPHRTKEQPTVTEPTEPDELTGAFGTARRIPRADYRDTSPAALDGWVITAPCWHPLWSQYHLGVVTLAHIPGAPEPHLQRPGVTHELNVVALNPEHGPYDPAKILSSGLRYLTPVNIGEQFTTTDEQARRLGFLCARAVVDGLLCPETADAPDRIRAYWRTSISRTLDHHRDPHHGHAN